MPLTGWSGEDATRARVASSRLRVRAPHGSYGHASSVRAAADTPVRTAALSARADGKWPCVSS
ncbi:hypothetical protein [Streptomyces phytohabitans]|uniref:hypothetical protein n=1 Tax=Streptomyces phytohabitans TaxID=1150371 RepID=UPI00345B8E99